MLLALLDLWLHHSDCLHGHSAFSFVCLLDTSLFSLCPSLISLLVIHVGLTLIAQVKLLFSRSFIMSSLVIMYCSFFVRNSHKFLGLRHEQILGEG